MNLLQDIITYIRRIIKSPSDAQISDSLIVDYINRFWIMDVDARLQLFDLKTKYQFQTVPGVDQYNMPLYDIQPNPLDNNTLQAAISYYPVYQGFISPAYVNGIPVPLQTQKNSFFNIYPNVIQNAIQVGTGNGTTGPYTLSIPLLSNPSTPINPPVNCILRGHVDINGIIATEQNEDPPLVTSLEITNEDPFIQNIPVTSVFPAVYFTSIGSDGSSIVISDSGQFLEDNQNYGLLIQTGKAPFGNLPLTNGPSPHYTATQNTINYLNGIATNVYFPVNIPEGAQINAQCYFYQTGLPRSILYFNNTLTLRSPPDRQYLVEMDAYLSPAAYLATGQAVQFAYMSEYIARGAARKILADTGDIEQFSFYEPLFKEQETLLWKRSQRQWTNDRTMTIYSTGYGQGQWGYNTLGASTLWQL